MCSTAAPHRLLQAFARHPHCRHSYAFSHTTPACLTLPVSAVPSYLHASLLLSLLDVCQAAPQQQLQASWSLACTRLCVWCVAAACAHRMHMRMACACRHAQASAIIGTLQRGRAVGCVRGHTACMCCAAAVAAREPRTNAWQNERKHERRPPTTLTKAQERGAGRHHQRAASCTPMACCCLFIHSRCFHQAETRRTAPIQNHGATWGVPL
jgi:hypothetical protein